MLQNNNFASGPLRNGAKIPFFGGVGIIRLDLKFPGNPTRSYRSQAPLRIIGEVTDWNKLTPEEVQQWRGNIAKNNGDIIN
jgi:Rifampin ADP-ribosyl transferase